MLARCWCLPGLLITRFCSHAKLSGQYVVDIIVLAWGFTYVYVYVGAYMPSNLQLTLAASWSEVWDDAHVAEVTWQLLSIESGVLYCSSPDTACHAIVISHTCMHSLQDIKLALARRLARSIQLNYSNDGCSDCPDVYIWSGSHPHRQSQC